MASIRRVFLKKTICDSLSFWASIRRVFLKKKKTICDSLVYASIRRVLLKKTICNNLGYFLGLYKAYVFQNNNKWQPRLFFVASIRRVFLKVTICDNLGYIVHIYKSWPLKDACFSEYGYATASVITLASTRRVFLKSYVKTYQIVFIRKNRLVWRASCPTCQQNCKISNP